MDVSVEAHNLELADVEEERRKRMRMIEEIVERVKPSKKNDLKSEEIESLKAVKIYLSRINDGCNKQVAAVDTAKYVLDKSPSYSRRIIAWAKQWEDNKEILLSRRGKHPKTRNLLNDNDFYIGLRTWINEKHPFDITPDLLRTHVNTVYAPALGYERTISLTTAQRWLRALGWRRSEVKKGIYFDGHERPDVVAYRKEFLDRMLEYEKRMVTVDAEDQTIIVEPTLKDGEKAIVYYTHDECIFYSNDGQKVIWHPDGRLPLRKKGQGRSIMVSDFLSEIDGPLKGIDGDGKEIRAREIIHPGKNHDGYWTGIDVAQQFKKAIGIHKRNHPNRVGLWAFDNSSNHNCFAKDALLVSRMNLSPGGGQNLLKDTEVNGVKYSMVFPMDHPDEALRGKAKGMKQVLLERGLWRVGLGKSCAACTKEKDKDPCRTSCCASRILELQPDFKAQRSLLVEIGEQEGQHVIFYPKFHCELNFIEMYWGASKRYTRKNCNYSFAALQKIVPKALDSVDIETVRRYAWMAFRYMDAYRQGLQGLAADQAVKQFKSHRRVSERQMEQAVQVE